MSLINIQGNAADSAPIVGIDLGTTNSLVAIVKDGKPEVLSSREGERLVPSVVSFSSGHPVVGYAAKKAKVRDASHTVFSVKRLLGRGLEDLRDVAGNLPYRIVSAEEAADGIVRIAVGGRQYTVVEISAMILRELKASAEAALGTSVSRAVITVPAYFNDSQRQATRAAGRLAGLDVLRIVNEPTAASLAYGLAKKREGLIAVYDLGGGTFDISILKLHDGIFEVLSTHGDTALGGDDMDQAIAARTGEEIHKKYGVTLSSASEKAALIEAAENLKIALSEQEVATLRLPLEIEGRQETFVHEWTLAEFEAWVAPVLERTRKPCLQALQDAGLKPSDLSDVVLVGGPTRLRCVQEMARSIFEREPNTSMHPDEVVAQGAAIQADILAGNNKDFLLLDVVPLSLGIETYGGLMSVLIPRNTRIPTAAREVFTTFADNQTGVDVHVLQGERERVEDNRSLARFKLKGIAPMPARMPRVEVIFLIDADGILQVTAKDLLSGKEQIVEVRPTHGLTDDEVEKILLSSAENAEEDVEYRAVVEARNHVEPTLRTVEKRLPDARRLLSSEEVAVIEARIEETRDRMKGRDASAIQKAGRELDRATRRLADLLVAEAMRESQERSTKE